MQDRFPGKDPASFNLTGTNLLFPNSLFPSALFPDSPSPVLLSDFVSLPACVILQYYDMVTCEHTHSDILHGMIVKFFNYPLLHKYVFGVQNSSVK